MDRILTVVGSTGNQGGSLVDNVLSCPALAGKFSKIRCLTRNPKSEQACALAQKSSKIEVVACDITKKDDLQSAFKGSWAVFAVTNYYDPSTGLNEEKIGSMMADVAKECGVSCFIWSSLENAKARSNGKYNVPHFDNKAKVDEHIRKIGLPHIIVEAPFYYENFLSFFPPKKDEKSGKYLFNFPVDANVKLPAFRVLDIGKVVTALLCDPEKYMGKKIPIAGDYLTIAQYVDKMAQKAGKTIEFCKISMADFETAYGKDLAGMMGYFQDFGYFPPETDLHLCRSLAPNLLTFDQWLQSIDFHL